MTIPNQNRAFPIKRRKTEDTLVSWDSVTTADGNAGGISLIDSGLIGMNDFITDQVTVIILGGAANLERQLCTAFNPATGEVDFSALSAQIVAGTPYRLTGLMSPEALAVPLPDSANNVLMRDVVGNKTDTPVSTVSATASLMAYMKAIINGAGGTESILSGSTTANWQTAAAVVCTIGAVGVRNKVHSAIIDISALVGNITAAMFISVNGNQRQVFPPKAGTTFNVTNGDAPGLALINGTFGIANILTIEVQSDNVADNGAAIGFEFMLEAM